VKTHRFDLISLVFGIVAIAIGIPAINGRLGNLVNDRPDALVPLIILGAGLVAVAVALKRGIGAGDSAPLLQDVDGAGNHQGDRGE
jgi:hypothetical protein